MSAGPPSEGLRRIAMLIAADLREGSAQRQLHLSTSDN
jgi:hypothetical protein